jgi:hypothetical protein
MVVYPGCYTGVHGVCTSPDGDEEVIEFDITVTRGPVVQPRSGKYGPLKVPGDVDVKITLKKILSDGKFFGRIINATPIAGVVEALLAASAVMKATAGGEWTAMTDTDIASESRVELTLQTNAVTVAGTSTLIGEAANGDHIEETLDVPAGMLVGAKLQTSKLFKKVFGIFNLDVDTVADTGTFKVDSIAGAAKYTVGDPSIFLLTGKWDKGTPEILFTCDDCFLVSAKTGFKSAKDMSLADYEIVMQDVDDGFDMSYVA